LRLAEAILYCRIPVKTAVDIGAGTGTILDVLGKLVPKNFPDIFAVEKYPPPPKYRTQAGNYIEGTLKDLALRRFDAGVCVEVVEHMTPRMVSELFSELATVANDGACFFFNTGLAEYTKKEEPEYIGLKNRGHIISWTVEAIRRLARPVGFAVTALPGRSWAFLVEKTESPMPIKERV
jgi:hypothetical protein